MKISENILNLNDHNSPYIKCYYNTNTGAIFFILEDDKFPDDSEEKDSILLPYTDYWGVRKAFFNQIEDANDYATLSKTSKKADFFRVVRKLCYSGVYQDIQYEEDEKILINWCKQNSIKYN